MESSTRQHFAKLNHAFNHFTDILTTSKKAQVQSIQILYTTYIFTINDMLQSMIVYHVKTMLHYKHIFFRLYVVCSMS